MQQKPERSPDVARAADRLARPATRMALFVKRTADVVLSLLMLVALIPLFALVWGLLAFAGEGYLEQRTRLGRDGQMVVLRRFRALPGGGFGKLLERIGARELPVLFAVLGGRLSFVGPSVVAPGTLSGHTGPRRLMAPGLTGPTQRGCGGIELDDVYVERWTLWVDAQMLAGRCPKL
jgi:lipopolysaccharide/colanic/teichoic acid biosynthesis glycosyltransferase